MPLSVEIVVARKFYLSNINCRRAAKIEHSGIVMLQQTQGNLYLETHKEMPYLPTTEKDLCFKYTDYLLHCLQFAYALSTREVSWDCNILSEFVNAISLQPKMLWSPFHNFPNTYRAQRSRYQFMRAQDLMQNLTGLNSHSEFKLLYLMSKEFLRRTLETAGYEYNVVTTAALTYLAALHFSSSEYQQAIRLCLAVLSDQTPEEEKETLNAGCLLFIDDVARIVGLCVLHKKVIDNNLKYNGGRLCLDLRLSQEGFAHYLTALSSERSSTQTHFVRDFPDASFPMDNNVKALVKRMFVATLKSRTQRSDVRQIVYCRVDSLTETEATATNPSIVEDTVIELLMGIALENMMSFYTVILKDFGMQCNVVDCYRALYFYKCRNYDEMLQLCERILNEPDMLTNLKTFSYANVFMIPPLDSFFDGDVQSLLGFHTLFYYLSPMNDDMDKFDETDDSTFQPWFTKYVKFARIGLDVFLLSPYFSKCQYFLGRHFLARYLKVRCCIDCNLPYKEAMTEFAAQKTDFPFELIIRRFLLRRHRISREHSIVKNIV